MNHSDYRNGQSTQDASRKEGWQEGQGQQNLLQQQAYSDAGGVERKRNRIIYIENATQDHKPFVIEEVNTVEEVTQKVCERYPEICLKSLGFRISHMRAGALRRHYFTEFIPYDYDTLYISLYLKKH